VLWIWDVYSTVSQILIFPSRIQGKEDPGFASKNLMYLTQKTVSLGKIFWDLHPRSGLFSHPGYRGQIGSGFATLVRTHHVW
jgi:hypothetical protein